MSRREQDWTIITGQKVTKVGRINIDKDEYQRHSIRPGDVIDVIIKTDGLEYHMGETVVNKGSRLDIPNKFVEFYGLRDSIVDLEIYDTGRQYPR